MGFTEAASDDGELSGRGAPWKRGLASGVMTTLGGLGHALPYLITDFWTATTIAVIVVFFELWAIAWIQNKYMETPFFRAAFQVGRSSLSTPGPSNHRGGSGGAPVVSQAGSTVSVDVSLMGLGAVRVFVRDTSGQPVPGAEVTLRFSRFGRWTTLQSSTPEPDDAFLFPSILAGAFSADAVEPVSGLRASGSGTVPADTEVTLELVLQPSGTVSVMV